MAKLNAQGKTPVPGRDPAAVAVERDDLKATLALSSDDLNALLEEVKKLQAESESEGAEGEPTDPAPMPTLVPPAEILPGAEPLPAKQAPRRRLFSKWSGSG